MSDLDGQGIIETGSDDLFWKCFFISHPILRMKSYFLEGVENRYGLR